MSETAIAMNTETRTEKDSIGEIEVPSNKYWGAQTQRSMLNFDIGTEKMPAALIKALGTQKKAAALTNMDMGMLDTKIGDAIVKAADEVITARWPTNFPYPLANWLWHTKQHEHQRSHRQPRH